MTPSFPNFYPSLSYSAALNRVVLLILYSPQLSSLTNGASLFHILCSLFSLPLFLSSPIPSYVYLYTVRVISIQYLPERNKMFQKSIFHIDFTLYYFCNSYNNNYVISLFFHIFKCLVLLYLLLFLYLRGAKSIKNVHFM